MNVSFSLLQTAFQFAYTCLFGWYASYLFLRSSSVLPPLLAHMFCNIMGFPQMAVALHNHPKRKTCQCPAMSSFSSCGGLLFPELTVTSPAPAIIATYVLGIAGFVGLFKPLTDVLSVFGGSLYWS